MDLRQARAALVFDDLEAWLAGQLTRISGKSPLAAAIRYALTHPIDALGQPLSR